MCRLHIEAAMFCLQIILPIQTSSNILPPQVNSPTSKQLPADAILSADGKVYLSPLPISSHNGFGIDLSQFLWLLGRDGENHSAPGSKTKIAHSKTLHICLKCQLPLFGEASLNQMDGCFQQSYMYTVNQPLRVWLLPQLTELRWWLSLSGIDFPTISTYLWHHCPRNGRPPSCIHTPLKFNIAPENGWLEDCFPSGRVTFQGLC